VGVVEEFELATWQDGHRGWSVLPYLKQALPKAPDCALTKLFLTDFDTLTRHSKRKELVEAPMLLACPLSNLVQAYGVATAAAIRVVAANRVKNTHPPGWSRGSAFLNSNDRFKFANICK
jgi:hypothetical protein